MPNGAQWRLASKTVADLIFPKRIAACAIVSFLYGLLNSNLFMHRTLAAAHARMINGIPSGVIQAWGASGAGEYAVGSCL